MSAQDCQHSVGAAEYCKNKTLTCNALQVGPTHWARCQAGRMSLVHVNIQGVPTFSLGPQTGLHGQACFSRVARSDPPPLPVAAMPPPPPPPLGPPERLSQSVAADSVRGSQSTFAAAHSQQPERVLNTTVEPAAEAVQPVAAEAAEVEEVAEATSEPEAEAEAEATVQPVEPVAVKKKAVKKKPANKKPARPVSTRALRKNALPQKSQKRAAQTEPAPKRKRRK